MKDAFIKLATSLSFLWAAHSIVIAASTSPALLKTKQEAEARGYIFETSHDEIVAKAKKEGKLRVITSLEPETYAPFKKGLEKKYPFLDVHIEEITGTDSNQRFLLEMNAGVVDWDSVHAAPDFYSKYLSHFKKFDILGMAEQGVLAIPREIVDAKNRNVVVLVSYFGVVAYNKKLISPDKVPNTWEDFLRPEFKGRKIIVDIRPQALPSLIPVMGKEWVLDYARKLAAQEPVWARGLSRAISSVTAGEYALHQMTNYHSTVRAMKKDPTGSLQFKIVEPVPVRLTLAEAVYQRARHPYAGLLFLEYVASPEGQAILDEYGPLSSSIYSPGSHNERLLKGKKLAVSTAEHFEKQEEWRTQIVEAFGFPNAIIK